MTKRPTSSFDDLFAVDARREERPAAPAPSRRVPKPDTVSQLTRRIRSLIELNLSTVWVEGEISNFKAHDSGHYYFTLKDATSQIPAVMFRGANARLKFKPDNGITVVVTGSVQLYEPQGKYQIVCETMEPSGIGALMLRFEQLKKQLAAEGLFDASRKKPLPLLPRTVGVVTSPAGAAIRDIINILFRRFPNMRLVLNPVAVQGAGAAEQIARAVDECNEANRLHQEDPGRHRLWFDVLIVGRGGGSMEDLWAFNEEVVARAIARSDIPIISAVGHETDWTMADFVADMRAPTPSAAAELVVQPRESFVRTIAEHRRAISSCLAALLEQYSRRVAQARTHYAFREPPRLVDQHRQHVDELMNAAHAVLTERMADITTRSARAQQIMASARRLMLQQIEQTRQTVTLQCTALNRTAAAALSEMRHGVVNQLSQLEALGPASVVKRGYTITRTAATGAVVMSANDVRVGDGLRTDFRDGHVESTVVRMHLTTSPLSEPKHDR